MQKIDPERYQRSLNQLTELFAGLVVHADELSQSRCPYKNRLNQCTANFGCRNKRKSPDAGSLPTCAGDDQLDYRGAWES